MYYFMSYLGYYSIIQYVPKPERAEGINLGLLLFIDENRFFKVKVTQDNKRVCLLFNGMFNDDWLSGAKDSMKRSIERLLKNSECFHTDITKFINTRMNEILLTPLKPVKIVSPEKQFEEIYKELVL